MLEGATNETWWDWKDSLGPLRYRPGKIIALTTKGRFANLSRVRWCMGLSANSWFGIDGVP